MITPHAAGARFTEDSHELKLGDGLWKTVTGKGDFRHDYIDLNKADPRCARAALRRECETLYLSRAPNWPPEREQSAKALVAQVDSRPSDQAGGERNQYRIRLSHAHVSGDGAAEVAGEQDCA